VIPIQLGHEAAGKEREAHNVSSDTDVTLFRFLRLNLLNCQLFQARFAVG